MKYPHPLTLIAVTVTCAASKQKWRNKQAAWFVRSLAILAKSNRILLVTRVLGKSQQCLHSPTWQWMGWDNTIPTDSQSFLLRRDWESVQTRSWSLVQYLYTPTHLDLRVCPAYPFARPPTPTPWCNWTNGKTYKAHASISVRVWQPYMPAYIPTYVTTLTNHSLSWAPYEITLTSKAFNL